MITTETINRILGITESFQMHDVLMKALFCIEERNRIFDEFLQEEQDLSYDWFTNYFQEEQSNRKSFMQDYTPACLCRTLSGLVSDDSDILDECAGIGGLTISEWNRNPDRIFYLEELSDNSVALLLFNLSIRGVNAYVRHGDVLTNRFKKVYKLERNGRFSDITETTDKEYEVGTVISNPPYSLKFEAAEAFKEDIRYSHYGMPPKAKADYAFIMHALYRLKDNGQALFILPHGVLFRGQKEGEIRRRLLEDGMIEAVIGLPDKLFLNTQIPVCIIVLKKGRAGRDVLVIDASKEFIKGGKQNDMSEEQIQKLLDTYRNRQEKERYSRLVSINEIEQNEYNLNVPRYVDTFEKSAEIDLRIEVEKLEQLENEIHDSEMKLGSMLKTLTGDAEYEAERDRLVKHLETKEIHGLSEQTRQIDHYITQQRSALSNQAQVHLYDVAEFERSRKGVIYPEGSILIQVSATKGQLVYMDAPAEVDSKYGVITPKGIEPKYLYYILEMVLPGFLARYQTGLNINPDIFKHLEFTVHIDREVQHTVIAILDTLQEQIGICEQEITGWKDIKTFHLDGMFA